MSIIETGGHHGRATRVRDGVELPVPGTWALDPGHSDVAFVGRHLLFTKVRGRFTTVAGAVVVAERPEDSSLTIDIDIDMGSVDSGDATRDEHLRSPDLFDVARFPLATYRSTSVDWQGRHGTVHGDLTIHGVTRPVPLGVTFEGYARDPWGGDRAVFSASARIDREDFGLTWNMLLETGGVLVGKEVDIEISVETVLQHDVP